MAQLNHELMVPTDLAAKDSFFGLIGPHQHGTAKSCAHAATRSSLWLFLTISFTCALKRSALGIFLAAPRCPRSLQSKPRADILPGRPHAWFIPYRVNTNVALCVLY